MRDKRIATMARTLFPLARAVVLTAVDVPRAARPEEIARRAGGAAARLVLEPDPVRALARARALTPRGGVLVVAGSLYLVGEVLKSRRRRSGRRVP
jgi:dihydrofolate synthase/folylpolyglutamate synthase